MLGRGRWGGGWRGRGVSRWRRALWGCVRCVLGPRPVDKGCEKMGSRKVSDLQSAKEAALRLYRRDFDQSKWSKLRAACWDPCRTRFVKMKTSHARAKASWRQYTVLQVSRHATKTTSQTGQLSSLKPYFLTLLFRYVIASIFSFPMPLGIRVSEIDASLAPTDQRQGSQIDESFSLVEVALSLFRWTRSDVRRPILGDALPLAVSRGERAAWSTDY